MSFNSNYPSNAILRKAFNLYSDLYGATADIEPYGHAYLEVYKAIGDKAHRVWIEAKAKFGEGSVAHESAIYVRERAAEAEYFAAMGRYFAAVEELKLA